MANILIVDDSPTEIHVLTSILENMVFLLVSQIMAKKVSKKPLLKNLTSF